MPLDETDLDSVLGDHAQWHEQIGWDRQRQRVTGWRQRRLGAIVLHSQPMASLTAEQQVQGLLEGLRTDGLGLLPWSEDCRQWQARVATLAAVEGEHWPDVSDEALQENLESWLAPFLAGMRTLQDLKRVPLRDALNLLLTADQRKQLQRDMPEAITIPTGRRVLLDYTGKPWFWRSSCRNCLALPACQPLPEESGPSAPIFSPRRDGLPPLPITWNDSGGRTTRLCARICVAVIPSTPGRKILWRQMQPRSPNGA